MKHLFLLASSFGALGIAPNAKAVVTLINNDGTEYEFKVQCKNDQEPINEFVDSRGIVDLENGPCKFEFQNGQTITVPDNESIAITKGKVDFR